IEHRIGEIVNGAGMAFSCQVSLSFERCYPALVNDLEQTRFATEVMREVVGTDKVSTDIPAVMGSEDFSFMLLERPGCYVFLGNGGGDHRLPGHGPGPCLVHNPSYDFNDDIIPIGATYFVRLAQRLLKTS